MATNYTNLDFFDIKQQLIDHYQSKTEFQDVNFLGATANLMVDSMALVLHQAATHANFAMSETFLSSVLKRSNALSRALEMGYSTATLSAATMRIRIDVANNLSSDLDISIARGANFEASSGTSIPFINLDGVTLTKERDELGNYVDETVRTATFDVIQGKLITTSYTVNNMEDFEPYLLRESNIDGTQIRVSVDGVDWTRYDGTLNIDGSTEIYYVYENTLGQIEIKFGNNIIGKKPINAQIVKIEYITTIGENGNDVNVITYPTKSGDANWSLSVITNSIGGAKEQSTQRIANTAPLLRTSQKRAVIVNDYIGLLKTEFSWIDTLNVWGGEDNIPPIYGKVFIAIKPKGADYLAPTLADQVKTKVIDKYSVLGIIPEIVEPDYSYVNLVSEVFWKESKTDEDASTILSTYITPAINTFFTDTVSEFNQKLFFSKLVAAIDDSHSAITHNDSVYTVFKKYKPIPFSDTSFTLKYFNPIKPNSIVSDVFVNVSSVNIKFKDNGNGLLDEFRGDLLYKSGVGIVDYALGEITLNTYVFEVQNSTEIRIHATVDSQDLKSGANNIILLINSTSTMTRD